MNLLFSYDDKLAKYPNKFIDPGNRFFACVNVAGETNLSLPVNDIDIGDQSVTLIRDLKGFFFYKWQKFHSGTQDELSNDKKRSEKILSDCPIKEGFWKSGCLNLSNLFNFAENSISPWGKATVNLRNCFKLCQLHTPGKNVISKVIN